MLDHIGYSDYNLNAVSTNTHTHTHTEKWRNLVYPEKRNRNQDFKVVIEKQ